MCTPAAASQGGTDAAKNQSCQRKSQINMEKIKGCECKRGAEEPPVKGNGMLKMEVPAEIITAQLLIDASPELKQTSKKDLCTRLGAPALDQSTRTLMSFKSSFPPLAREETPASPCRSLLLRALGRCRWSRWSRWSVPTRSRDLPASGDQRPVAASEIPAADVTNEG